jgi:UDP-glucose:(heptosyl)LPS alpha-1,3-glucosyltransferase
MSLQVSSSTVRPVAIKKRLRIAILNRTFSPTGGGAERYSIALVEQLAAQHEIHVFAQKIDHQWPGVTYHSVSAPLHKPRWINQLWFAASTWWSTRHGFDVVHSHENTWHGDIQTVHVLPVKYNMFHGRVGWRRFLRWIKVIISPRLLAYLGLEYFRYAKRPGRQVIVTANSLLSIINSSYPTCSEMLSVITPGITMPKLAVTLERKNQARSLLGLPLIGRYALLIGNDYRKKGLQVVLNAMAQLPADISLIVVGNPAQISLFTDQVKTLNLVNRIFFLGHLKDVTPAYEAADCLVHPTLEDTFAMVVLEAMSHGLPVVVSGPKYCGIAELLQHGINAVILDDPQDASQVCYSLELVLAETALQSRLSKGAIAFAGQYQWHQIALEQERVYFLAATEKVII